jgi:hypothetical protein
LTIAEAWTSVEASTEHPGGRPMDPLSSFLEYAQAFEKTYVDDDWSRLERFFAPNATYTVAGVGADCRIEGREAIFRGLRKSLAGFDRKFSERIVDFSGTPSGSGNVVEAPWAVVYKKPGAPDFHLRGRSTARYESGVIAALRDDMEVDEAGAAWLAKHGQGLDPTYV